MRTDGRTKKSVEVAWHQQSMYVYFDVLTQEKADHRLKERLEETMFWAEEVQSEINCWATEKKSLNQVNIKGIRRF